MSVPNTFAAATSAIPLANLDADFAYYDAAFQIVGTAMEVNYTFRLEDPTDTTKKAEFVMSGITTGTTRQYTMPNASGTLATLANTSQTFLGSTTFAPTTNSGTVTIGATPQTGTLTFGRSTASQTVDIAVGATTAVSTKTVNIGTTGVSGSTTNINFGSAVAGAITNITLNSGTANGVTYLNASKVLTSGTALTFDGTNLGIGATAPVVKLEIAGNNNTLWTVTASISGVTMDVTAVSSGTIAVGDLVYGTNIQPYTRVTALGTGTGGVGTYTVSVFQTAASSATTYGTTQYGATLIRITDIDTNQAIGQPNGALQFFTSDASTPTPGVSAYVAALAESVTPDTSLVFGTRNNAGGGIDANERMRLDSNGNLGIGTSSPDNYNVLGGTIAAIAGTGISNLSIVSGVSSTGNILFADGTTGDDRRSGRIAYDHSLNNLYFFTNGNSLKATLDASGNLGLGVTPSAWNAYKAFDINVGSVASTATQVDFGYNFYWNGTNNIYKTTNGAGTYRINSAGQHLWFNAPSGTAGAAITFTQAMTLDASGNLGIGTTSPAAKLDVRGDSSSTTSMVGAYIYNGNSTLNSQSGVGFFNYDNFGAKIYSPRSSSPAGSLVFATNNGSGIAESNVIERMRLDSSGNLGIGTTSPVSILEVKAANPTLTISASGTTGSANTVLFKTGFSGVNGDAYIAGINAELRISGSTVGGANAFVTTYTSGTEKMRLDSSGNLLVGQTARSQTVVGAHIEGGGSTNPGTVSSILAASTNAASSYNLYSTGAGTFRFYVGMSGTIFATSTTITAISDQRLKENIRDLDDGLDTVMALKPRKFDWKEGKGKDIKDDRGFIAQEFEQVLPDMIEEWKDLAPEGEEPYKAVNANLIPTLVKAIQEQQALIESLTQRLTALESK